MEKDLMPYLIFSPSDASSAAVYTFRHGWLAYKIDQLHLMRGRISANVRGGMMIIADLGQTHEGSFVTLASEISNECAMHSYDGVVLDLDERPSGRTASIAGSICSELVKRKIPVFVPLQYEMFCPNANLIISSALSGGSLPERIKEVIEKHGNKKIAFTIMRMRMDFLMPSPEGEGKQLSKDEFDAIFENTGAQAFYSPEMCVNYFTYTDTAGQSHFVLFDDARSIAGKIHLARMLNIQTVLLFYPEIKDILPEITAGLD